MAATVLALFTLFITEESTLLSQGANRAISLSIKKLLDNHFEFEAYHYWHSIDNVPLFRLQKGKGP
jgi:hypothetical protein